MINGGEQRYSEVNKEIQSSLCDRRLDLAHAFLVATHTCAHLKHMNTNVIFLWRTHVYERETQKNVYPHTLSTSLPPSVLHPPEGCTVPALSSLLVQ